MGRFNNKDSRAGRGAGETRGGVKVTVHQNSVSVVGIGRDNVTVHEDGHDHKRGNI
jgi:hypothetical protein